MDRKMAGEQLPMGRAALAKAFTADWISEHSKTILLSFVTLIVVAFTLFQVMGRFSQGKKSDYLQIQSAFSAWLSKEVQDPKLMKNLEKPLSSHPELQAKFGTQIAQRLLSLGEPVKASSYARAALKRSHQLASPYYTRFSQTTLAIAEGKFADALEEAKKLKTELEKDDAFWDGRDKLVKSGSILYAYNLVRIASLERELGFKEGELKAWEEFERNAGWKDRPPHLKTFDPEAYALIVENFTSGDISLPDFINQRKKEIATGN